MVSPGQTRCPGIATTSAKLVTLCMVLTMQTLPASAKNVSAGLAGRTSTARGAQANGAPVPSKRPYTVDDLLKIEEIKRTMSDPGGRWLVWEQAPPYDTLKDYGLGRLGSDGVSGFRVMALDTQTPGAVPKPLFNADGADSHWLDSFSPDGRYLAYARASEGVYSMGVFDFATGKTLAFDAAPDIDIAGRHRAVWISAHEFVFSAVPPGEEPIEAIRRSTGKSLWRDWNAAWRGDLSVNEVVSHALSGNEKPIGGRLIKADAQTGKTSVLADGLYNSLTVSPDGRYLAGLRQFPRVQSPPGVADLDWTTSRSALQVFDLVKGTSLAVAADKDIFPRTLEWAPDANRLAFFAWDLGAGVRSGIFHSFDAAAGQVTAMPHNGLDLATERERGLAEKPERAVWIGARLAVLARDYGDAGAAPRFTYRGTTDAALAAKPPRADWFLIDEQGHHENLTKSLAEPDAIPLDADGRSIAVLAGGQVWRVAPGQAPVKLSHGADGALALLSDMHYSDDHPPFGRFLTLWGQGPKGRFAASLDMRSGGLRQARFPSASVKLLAMGGETGVALFRTTSAEGTALVSRRNDKEPRDVLKLNAHLGSVEQTTFSALHYSVDSPVGRSNVDACMILPAGYHEGHRYPVIVDIYPGIGANACTSPSAVEGNKPGASGMYDLHLLAARGYIIFRPNTSHFLENRPPNPLGGMAHAVDAGLDALIAQGYADPDRIGLIGMSQGGYASLWLATQMKRFKAIVSINGWANMYSHRFEQNIYRRYYADQFPFRGLATRYEPSGDDSDNGTGVRVWDQPDAYVRNSPLFNARGVTAPVMLIHSDMDAFNLDEYGTMFTALYEQRKEARFLRYAGEGHGLSSPANIRHMWTSIFDWFDRYVGTANRDASSDSGGSTTAYVPNAKVPHQD